MAIECKECEWKIGVEKEMMIHDFFLGYVFRRKGYNHGDFGQAKGVELMKNHGFGSLWQRL